MACNEPNNPCCLAVDARGEVERVGVAAADAVAEVQAPQAGIRDGVAARVGEGAAEGPG